MTNNNNNDVNLSNDLNSAKAESFSSYQDYVDHCIKYNLIPISEESFSGTGLRFMPGLVNSVGSFVNDVGNKAMSNLARGMDPTTAVTMSLRDSGYQIVETVAPMVGEIILGGKQDTITAAGLSSGGSGKSRGPGGGSSGDPIPPGNSMRGTYPPNPLGISLRTNINPRVTADPYNYPSIYTSYCHLTGASFGFTADTYLNYHLSNVLIPLLQNRSQMAVTFNIDVSKITAASLTTYLDLLCRALQILYFYTSILSYTAIGTNPDRGMFALRQMISAADIDKITQLKLQLMAVPIPPNINKLCFWLMQTYTDSTNGQGIIKMMPIPFNAVNASFTVTGFGVTGATANMPTVLDGLIAELAQVNSSGIVPLLTKVMPSWVGNTIYDASPIPLYSRDFLSLFSNLPNVTHFNSTHTWGPVHVDSKTPVESYCVYSDDVDGMVTGLFSSALTGAASPTTAVWTNNFIKWALTTNTVSSVPYYVNRFSYIKKGTTGNFEWNFSNVQKEAAFGRPELRKVFEGVHYTARTPETINITNMSPETADQAGRDLMTWLLSIDTIQKTKKVYYDSNRVQPPVK